jgi:hypothetical protein
MAQDKTKSKKMTKAAGVRDALHQLGADAMPLEIQKYLRDTHNINMDAGMISSYKSAENRKRSGHSLSKRRGAAAASASGFSIDEISAVKRLTEKIGANRVRELAGLFGK